MRATDEAYIAETSYSDPENLQFNTFSSLVRFWLPNDNLYKNIFDFTIADDLNYVAAVERPPVLRNSVHMCAKLKFTN